MRAKASRETGSLSEIVIIWLFGYYFTISEKIWLDIGQKTCYNESDVRGGASDRRFFVSSEECNSISLSIRKRISLV